MVGSGRQGTKCVPPQKDARSGLADASFLTCSGFTFGSELQLRRRGCHYAPAYEDVRRRSFPIRGPAGTAVASTGTTRQGPHRRLVSIASPSGASRNELRRRTVVCHAP